MIDVEHRHRLGKIITSAGVTVDVEVSLNVGTSTQLFEDIAGEFDYFTQKIQGLLEDSEACYG